MPIEVYITSFDDSSQVTLYCGGCRNVFKIFNAPGVLLADIQEAENDHYLEHLLKMQEIGG